MPGTAGLLVSLFNGVEVKASLKVDFSSFNIPRLGTSLAGTSTPQPLQPLLLAKFKLENNRKKAAK